MVWGFFQLFLLDLHILRSYRPLLIFISRFHVKKWGPTPAPPHLDLSVINFKMTKKFIKKPLKAREQKGPRGKMGPARAGPCPKVPLIHPERLRRGTGALPVTAVQQFLILLFYMYFWGGGFNRLSPREPPQNLAFCPQISLGAGPRAAVVPPVPRSSGSAASGAVPQGTGSSWAGSVPSAPGFDLGAPRPPPPAPDSGRALMMSDTNCLLPMFTPRGFSPQNGLIFVCLGVNGAGRS